MTDRDNGGFPTDQERFSRIMTRPTEINISAEGSFTVMSEALIVSSDEETADLAIREFEEVTGAKILERKEIRPEDQKAAVIAFMSGKWKAPWEPEGPKPNWGPPPDPSLN